MNPYNTLTTSEAKKMIFELYRELIISGKIDSKPYSGLDRDEAMARNALGLADTAIVEFLAASNAKVIDDLTGREWSGIGLLKHCR